MSVLSTLGILTLLGLVLTNVEYQTHCGKEPLSISTAETLGTEYCKVMCDAKLSGSYNSAWNINKNYNESIKLTMCNNVHSLLSLLISLQAGDLNVSDVNSNNTNKLENSSNTKQLENDAKLNPSDSNNCDDNAVTMDTDTSQSLADTNKARMAESVALSKVLWNTCTQCIARIPGFIDACIKDFCYKVSGMWVYKIC